MVARSFGVYEFPVAIAPLRTAVDAEQLRASIASGSFLRESPAVTSWNVAGKRSTILHSHASGLQ